MLNVNGKAVLLIFAIGVFFAIGCNGPVQGAAQPCNVEDEAVISDVLDSLLKQAANSQEISIYTLDDSQIKAIILPIAPKLIAKTVEITSEKIGKNITINDVFNACPAGLNNSLNKRREQITLEVEDLLKKDE